MVATQLSTKTRMLIVAAFAFAALANISVILLTGVRGQKTCEEVENLKAPEYQLAKENLKNIDKYKSDYIRLFGTEPKIDPSTGQTVPRWKIEFDRAVRIQTERINRFSSHECPLLFWNN